MEIQCPSCQKRLAIGDQYAGQLVKCPSCNGVFMAPALVKPPVAAAEAPPSPPPAPQDIIPFTSEPAPRPESPYTAPPLPPAPPPVVFEEEAAGPPGDFTKSHTLKLCPDILRWVGPGALGLIFLLSFFSWTQGVEFSAPPKMTKTDFDKMKEGDFEAINKAMQDAVERKTAIPSLKRNLWEISFGDHGSATYIIYILLVVFLALPLAVAKLLMEMNVIPKVEFLRPFWKWRSLAVAGILAIAVVMPLVDLFKFNLIDAVNPTSIGMKLAIRIHLIAMIAFGLEYWLLTRKKDRLPLPEVTARW